MQQPPACFPFPLIARGSPPRRSLALDLDLLDQLLGLGGLRQGDGEDALTDHFRKTLDEPIPALGNQTPRNAVKTAKGRTKVIAWLKMLENQSAQQRPEDPMGAYDFTWLWRELGVGDERR